MKAVPAIAFLIFVACSRGEQPAQTATGAAAPASAAADAGRGKELIDKYACAACHAIPGFEQGGSLGPSLEGIGSRPQISGRAANNRETMTAYIVDPTSVDPPTRMPAVGATPEDARDIAAFLFTLR